MRRVTIQPTGEERRFGEDEIIVTKTDLRGVITYANDVFLRVSAYGESDVLGKPHSIVRHPDMPRAVFKRLWDTIATGEEMFAYIMNLAADGAHYWVFAHVTPSFNEAGRVVGYHSNRRVPDRAAVNEVQAVYTQLRGAERAARSGKQAVEESCARFDRVLAERGQSYDEFVWQLTALAASGAR